jgi:hypothetical protein
MGHRKEGTKNDNRADKRVRKEIHGKEGNKTKLKKGKILETNSWSFKRNYFS